MRREAHRLCIHLRAVYVSIHHLAETLGLPADAVLDVAGWVNTGSEQLVIPLGRRRRCPAASRSHHC